MQRGGGGHPPPSAFVAGLACRCPRCGAGRLYDGFLALRERCEICGLDFAAADTGDGPAVFLILIVGAIVVFAAVMGIVGGLLPAARAARMPISQALREV